MDSSYDEDLSQNPFFVEFRSEHPDLLEQCIANDWLICVPRIGTVLSHIFTLQDFLGHILVSNEDLPETHFTTLTERSLRVISKVISIDQNNAGLPSEIHILFEETFYTVDHLRYKVWCVEYPLESEFQLKTGNVSMCAALLTLRDCIDYLWTESSGKDVLESMDTNISNFKTMFSKVFNISLGQLKDMVGTLYTSCLQTVFSNRRLKERCRDCKSIMDNVKLAVETYMLHGIYKEIFAVLSTCSANEDSSLNKIIRNISDLQLRDLDITKNFYECIPLAKRNLSFIQSYGTVLGKVGCIRKTITTINKCTDTQTDGSYVTTDELLPIFIFLVIKCGLPNWYAHLNFIKHFRFSVHSHHQSDEVSFCISTLEAVVEHISSGIFTHCPYPESQCPFEDEFDYGNKNRLTNDQECFEMIGFCNKKHKIPKLTDNSDGDSLSYLFEQVKSSNYEKVKQILQKNQINHFNGASDENEFEIRKTVSLDEVLNEDDFEKPLTLCHPLCNCYKCSRIVTNNMLRTSPTVFSCDEHGFTVLHVASIFGQPLIVDMALEMGAHVNSTDYNGSTPLHYAASRGHQNIIFLLLQAGADVNQQNMDKNTPLHLACNNGHECCVKAIIYFNEFKYELKIDIQNDNGDTPIHLASKWGYIGIVGLLLEHGADPWIKNKKGKTAIDFAHSTRTSQLLISSALNLSEFVNYDRNQIKKELKIYEELKDDVTLLDMNDNNDIMQSSINKSEVKSINGGEKRVKPASTNDIHQIERLFRAIAYGDCKLACFFMNFDKSVKGSTSKTEVSAKNLCHPLCMCKACVKLKVVESETDTEFNVNTCDSQGNTALHIAVKHGRMELCEILLANGAIPNLQNKNGSTPLHVAAQENRVKAAELLIEASDTSIKDSFGNTPLHLASKEGKTALDEAKDNMNLTIIDILEKKLCSSLIGT